MWHVFADDSAVVGNVYVCVSDSVFVPFDESVDVEALGCLDGDESVSVGYCSDYPFRVVWVVWVVWCNNDGVGGV